MINGIPRHGITYLASPYSHRFWWIRWWRYIQVCRAAGALMRQGYVVYSPIAHTHPIAVLCGLPKGWDYWRKIDEAFLQRCDALFVLHIDGWDQSVGVQAEVEIAERLGLPIKHIALDVTGGIRS